MFSPLVTLDISLCSVTNKAVSALHCVADDNDDKGLCLRVLLIIVAVMCPSSPDIHTLSWGPPLGPLEPEVTGPLTSEQSEGGLVRPPQPIGWEHMVKPRPLPLALTWPPGVNPARPGWTRRLQPGARRTATLLEQPHLCDPAATGTKEEPGSTVEQNAPLRSHPGLSTHISQFTATHWSASSSTCVASI